jgi:hypothetical protein
MPAFHVPFVGAKLKTTVRFAFVIQIDVPRATALAHGGPLAVGYPRPDLIPHDSPVQQPTTIISLLFY